MNENGRLENLKFDIPAGIVVFFVAVPLCLGIALASGAPLFSGIVSGMVGGIVVGIASGSRLGVSGPAAGLSAVILTSLITLGNSWEAFLLAVMLAGILQVLAGMLGGGIIAYYFPSSVIKGMLSGIGIIIILKQVPLALGLNGKTKGMMLDEGTHHLFTPFRHILHSIHLGPTLITIGSLALLILYDKLLAVHYKIFRIIQGPIIVVFLGILVTWLGDHGWLPFVLTQNELVNIPVPSSTTDFLNQFHFPDFSQITNIEVYKIAIVIALIASLETLLCVEATDKLDPEKQITPTDRELKAQGLGNILCGLIGGLPITQVIVRSSANITFGAKTKVSTIFHGLLLLLCVTTIPTLLNMIPLSVLAAILFIVGYKLAEPIIFIKMYRLGWEQFLPFIITIIGIILKDLLVGIAIGMAFAIFIILRNHYKNSHEIFHYEEDEQKKIHLTLAEEVSFLNKGSILREFKNVPYGARVIIDFSRSKIVDNDVLEAIQNFIDSAKSNNIKVQCIEGNGVGVTFLSK